MYCVRERATTTLERIDSGIVRPADATAAGSASSIQRLFFILSFSLSLCVLDSLIERQNRSKASSSSLNLMKSMLLLLLLMLC